jgi:hypothetical protein
MSDVPIGIRRSCGQMEQEMKVQGHRHIVPVSQFLGSSLLEWSLFAMGPGSSSMILSIHISPLVWVLGVSHYWLPFLADIKEHLDKGVLQILLN